MLSKFMKALCNLLRTCPTIGQFLEIFIYLLHGLIALTVIIFLDLIMLS